MSLRDYYLEIPIPGHGAIRVTGTQTNLAALRGYIAGLDRTIETERRDHAKTRALHGTACDQVESFERQLVEAKETIARLNALQRAEADRHRTTPDALDQIEATLRKTYNRPTLSLWPALTVYRPSMVRPLKPTAAYRPRSRRVVGAMTSHISRGKNHDGGGTPSISINRAGKFNEYQRFRRHSPPLQRPRPRADRHLPDLPHSGKGQDLVADRQSHPALLLLLPEP